MKAIYFFDQGDGKNKQLLGGKGAGLCEMTSLGLPVPPGFVITTKVCKAYYDNDSKEISPGIKSQIRKGIKRIEKETGKSWKSKTNPLLVSVRSGAALSMPGMMDTILNLGLNDDTVLGLAEKSGNPRFAWDSYRRLIQLFGKVVLGVDDKIFEDILDKAKKDQRAQSDSDLSVESLKDIVSKYKKACSKYGSGPFPSDPDKQLDLAVNAVFDSWMGERAIVYRKQYGITEEQADGTAVNVVAMVFGNMGDDSATGVVFTRNPASGKKEIFGDYLVNAQGEDVVAGTRTPKPVGVMKKEMPEQYKKLKEVCGTLECHYREPQDIEFTIEEGKFYLLQTRNAKMNAIAMVKTSVDMVREKLISQDEALLRLDPEQMEQLLHRRIDEDASKNFAQFAKGIAASPGAAVGIAVFDVKRAIDIGDSGKSVILIREETKPEDVPAFFASSGILTSRGGKASHAALVARGMGKPCIVGASNIKIEDRRCIAKNHTISEGDIITIDGGNGIVYADSVPTIKPKMTSDFKKIRGWAQDTKKIGIRANADTPEAAMLARKYGAHGIGLCRTERMFNAEDRLSLFVEMIMEENSEKREQILKDLGKLQKKDFVKILKAMQGYHVTIRLLDPPLHEFLPNPEERSVKSSKTKKKSEIEKEKKKLARARELSEINPMMGHRGVRLGITNPEIYDMQVKAILEASADLAKKGTNVRPQIMVPQVGSIEELNFVKSRYDAIKKEIEEQKGVKLKINFGTMIEVVRAALVADRLAGTAEFFSFGTNDLTQAAFSFSREDVEGKFLIKYLDDKILPISPFQTIDADGVGELIKIGVSKGRAARPGLEIGICGEHGGDPKSVEFCYASGLSYVSASPHRIPIAIIAAAQAALKSGRK